MNAPVSLRKGNVLLLAEPHSFSASYIRRSLDAFGVPVIVPSGPPGEALANLEPAEWLSVSACIATTYLAKSGLSRFSSDQPVSLSNPGCFSGSS